MSQPIKLGFMGVSVSSGAFGGSSWATQSHIPYLVSPRNDGHYKITAVQNSSKTSGETAVAKLKLGDNVACYDNPQDLASDSNVDLIAVSVNVPLHYDLVMPALEAGKDVFVEWPLARNLADAEAMCQLAREKNVKTIVGLQARHNPSVLAAKKIVVSGQIGEVIGTTMYGHGPVFGAVNPQSLEYMYAIENGANMMTISFGHAIDALCFVLGELEYVQATLANRRPEFDVSDDQGKVVGRSSKNAHDFISMSGTLEQGGGVVNVVYQGGMNPTGAPGFVWQINGTKGSVILEGPNGHVQMFQPTVKAVFDGETELKDVDGVKWVGNDFSHGPGKAWEAFALHQQGKTADECGGVTTFKDALVRHKMIDAIYKSNESGRREKYI